MLIIFIIFSTLFDKFFLECKRCQISWVTKCEFNSISVQQLGTYIQDAHSAPSIKDKSHSALKK